MLCIFALSGLATGHSFLDIVGVNGIMRGGNLTTDTEKERYFCPRSTLTACQPPSSSKVVLTADAMRPCRKDYYKQKPMGSAVAGGNMYLHWGGNGHTAVNGTCVKVGITRFSPNPDASAFRTIAECLPFAHGPNNQLTDANITIPRDLVAGDYTIFWVWDFFPFWYSSCADISVTAQGAPTIAPQISMTDILYATQGCGTINKEYCQQTFGLLSYCKTWFSDTCGRNMCHMDLKGLGGCSTTRAPTLLTTLSPSLRSKYEQEGCTALGPNACRDIFGSLSFCKTWATDSCNRSVCQGSDFAALTKCPPA
jgi:hypothetical protein